MKTKYNFIFGESIREFVTFDSMLLIFNRICIQIELNLKAYGGYNNV